jgi:murein DD-endopeptidase MepM/ murein hydrolase activator NlpD
MHMLEIVKLLPGNFVKISAALCLFSTGLQVLANNFHGYYCPTVQISPMADNVTYTPVGLGIVTSKAGFRIHPITGRGDFHSGVDLAAHLNDRVYNLMDGFVTRAGWRGALGVAVEIYHPYPNVRSIYGHLNAFSVVPGQWVKRGQVIGFAGSTGRSTGVHVHYTVIREDTKQYIEPLAFLGQVPKYVSALKKARVQAELAKNIQKHKEAKLASSADETKTRTSSEDLPPSSGEVKPPAIDE